MSDNEFDDASFLDGERNRVKSNKYSRQRFPGIACSPSIAIVMGVATLITVVTIAAIAAFFRPFCNCQDAPTTTPKVLTVKPVAMAESPWKSIRLPETVIPVSYHIDLHVKMTEFNFTGHVKITASVKSDTSLIVLHIHKAMTFSKIKVTKREGGDEVNVKKASFVIKTEILCLNLESAIKTGTKVDIDFYYHAPLSSSMEGLYKSSYKSEQGKTKYLAVSHFEPTNARKAFPCFDEPALKATYEISIRHDAAFLSRSNMPLKTTETESDGTVTDTFKESVKMSTYLVAFLVAEYDFISTTTDNGVTVRVNAPPQYKNDLDLALAAAANITAYYSSFFGTDFPLPKQDLVAVPDFAAGAMENWGMITYRMVAILYNKNNPDIQRRYVIKVIAHELAHQWFGNLVTMKWWNDLWLNEGFASYVENLGTHQFDSSYNTMESFVCSSMQSALAIDALESSHPISVKVDDPAQINSLFDSISYSKGSSIIRMLSGLLEKHVFQDGLKKYLQKYAYSNAESDDLWEEFTKASKVSGKKIDVKKLMKSWTMEMGYPLVTVTRDSDKIHLSQKRFLITGSKDVGVIWQVPIVYVTDDNSEATVKLLDTAKQTFSINNDAKWYKVNWGYESFFRANYDKSNWDALIHQLVTDHQVFSPSDRTNLISDVFSLAVSGDNDYTTALDMSSYLKNERSYAPWSVTSGQLGYIKDRLANSKETLSKWKAYIVYLMNDTLVDLGYEDTGSLFEKSLRSILWSATAKLGHKKSIDNAKKLFNDFMLHGKPLNVNLKSVISSIGVATGGEKEWNFCWGLFEKSTDPSEMSILRYNLGQTKDKKILQKYLEWSLDPTKIREQDISSIIGIVAFNPLGSKLAWSFVVKHYKILYEKFGKSSFSLSGIIKSVTQWMSTPEQLKEVTEFFKNHEMGSAELASKQSLEAIELHINWINKNEATVSGWLEDNFDESLVQSLLTAT